MQGKSILIRFFATILVIFGSGIVSSIYNPQATLIAGKVAGQQFSPSDGAYLSASYILSSLSTVNVIIGLLALLLLVCIWFAPARLLVEALKASSVVALLAFSGIGRADAYYDTKDITEAYTILPNESAFWIPDVGNNKDDQAKMDSEAYYAANKLAVKRFLIPHVKLSGTGGSWGWDAYVPAGRLIIVPRTPYSREWVDAHDRGTAKTKQGFPCQTKEGLNITAGVSIGTSVMEANAAKYLYRAGVANSTTQGAVRTDPAVIFQSVYYGRSLENFMDDIGRKKVQTLICAEISSRTFDQANADTNPIMVKVEKDAKDYFAAYGITLDFIGWADTFTFDDPVQKAVNDKYIANSLASAMTTLQAVAQLKVQEGLGSGLANKGLPIVVTPDMINALIGLVKAPPPVK